MYDVDGDVCLKLKIEVRNFRKLRNQMTNITDDNYTRVYKRKEPIFGGMLSFIVSFLWGLQGVVITAIDEPRPLAVALADSVTGWVGSS